MFGLLRNFRFLGGIAVGVFVNQELGQDQIRFYVENPDVLYANVVEEVKKYSK